MDQAALPIERYRQKMGRRPDLDRPTRYTEKMLWRKLHDRRPLLTPMSDKLAGREYADLESPKLLLVSDDPDVDLSALPRPFVVKPNNWSGKKWFIDSQADFAGIRQALSRCAKGGYGHSKGEWAYQGIPFHVLAEEYLTDFVEIKAFCFDGRARILRHVEGSGRRISYYSPTGAKTGVRHVGREAAGPLPLWLDLSKITAIAERISHNLDHVRVDLYCLPERTLWGEYTFYSGSGCTRFTPDDFDFWLGSWWNLNL